MAIVTYIPDQTVAFDGANPPVRESGARLTFYLYDTLTKTPVYQDPDGTPSANPVLSLADGTWPAIYWDNDIRTRVIKTSPVGSSAPATWEVEDIGPTALDALRTDLTNVDATAEEGADFLDAIQASANNIQYMPPGAGAVTRTVQSRLRDSVSVLDYIPVALHAGIKAGTNTDDLTSYVRAAATAARSAISGAQESATVYCPNGRYYVSVIGTRDIIFLGESLGGTEFRAFSAGADTDYMFDAMRDVDGVTPNTNGGGMCLNMTIDARLSTGALSGRSAMRTYGGAQVVGPLRVRYAAVGVAAGLSIWSTFKDVQADTCGRGFFTFAGAGDSGTSTTFLNCWAYACTTYGFHISQLIYSSFINCVAQACGTRNWFIEGDLNGVPAVYSLQFIGCGSEGSGVPFYFKSVRELTVINPRIISPDASINYITFDNVTGSLSDFSTVASPTGGFYHLAILNHGGGDGTIILTGGTVTYDPANEALITSGGGFLNAVNKQQAIRQVWNNSAPTAVTYAEVADVDGFTGLIVYSASGQELMRLRRTGTPIFSTNGAINTPATNLNIGDVSFYINTGASLLTFVVKDGAGVVKTATAALT